MNVKNSPYFNSTIGLASYYDVVINKSVRNMPASKRTEARLAIEGVLSKLPNEAVDLLNAIENGKIDGKVYTGECSCLKGTLVKSRLSKTQPDRVREFEETMSGVHPPGALFEIVCVADVAVMFTDYAKVAPFDARLPEESWFYRIHKDDTPKNNLASARARTWVKAWVRGHHK